MKVRMFKISTNLHYSQTVSTSPSVPVLFKISTNLHYSQTVTNHKDHEIRLRYLQIYTILKPQMSGNKCPIRIINLQIPIPLYNPAQIPVYQNHVFFCSVRPVFNTQNAAPQIPCFSCQSMYLFTAKIILHSNENKKS